MEREWHQLLGKLAGLERLSGGVLRTGQSNMARYFAYLAYEEGAYREAASRLGASMTSWPKEFWSDLRNLKLSGAVLSGNVLPLAAHRALERMVGIRTSTTVESNGHGG
jgi:hypothetical protein